jgi:uncharacterized protein
VAEWPASLDVAALIASGWRPKPFREFILKVHSRCDLSCRYCYVYEMADQSWHDQPRRMSPAVLDQALARIAEHTEVHALPAIRLTLHGGEPLLAGSGFLRSLALKTRATLGDRVKVELGLQTNAVLLDAAFLKLFDEFDIHVSVSLDGTEAAHDRHRVHANGKGSHAAVVRSLGELTSDRFRHLFNGLLCTIDPRNPPVPTYEALLRFGPPAMDFLLPHGNWTAPPPGRISGSAETPYGDWLCQIFDRWYGAPRQETRVRLFSEIITLLLGGASTLELVGLSPASLVVVETDGSIQQSDLLKSAYEGAAATGLHVMRDSLDSALLLPGFVARQLDAQALGAECRSCEIMRVCGGGLFAHRYRAGDGFQNSSVYCPDLTRLINHIRTVVARDVQTLREDIR